MVSFFWRTSELIEIHVGGRAAAFDSSGNLWLADAYHAGFEGIYKSDFSKERYNLYHVVEGNETNKEWQHGKMKIMGDIIYLFPVIGESIYIYNFANNTKKIVKTLKEKDEAFYITEDGESIYLLSSKNTYMYRFKFGYELFDESAIIQGLKKVGFTELRMVDGTGDRIGKMSFFSCERKSIIEVELNDNSYKEISLNKISEELFSVEYMNDKYWILLNNSLNVYSCNPKTGGVIEYYAEIKEIPRSIPYNGLKYVNNQRILLNAYFGRIMKISEDDKRVKPLFEDEADSYNEEKLYGGMYSDSLLYGNNYYFIPNMGEYIVKINHDFQKEKKFLSMALLDDDEGMALFSNSFKSGLDVFRENDGAYSIKNYISYIVH